MDTHLCAVRGFVWVTEADSNTVRSLVSAKRLNSQQSHSRQEKVTAETPD